MGVAAQQSCSSEVMQHELIELLHDCTVAQSAVLHNVHHMESVFKGCRGKVQILFGPVSLLNNDNASVQITFMARK